MTTVSIDTTVKGGLPVIIEAEVFYDRLDAEYYIDEMTVFWANGKRVTDTVHDSIPQNDWDRIEDEIMRA